jgi:hypothetical protein
MPSSNCRRQLHSPVNRNDSPLTIRFDRCTMLDVGELVACSLIRSLLEATSLETSKIAWMILAWQLHTLRLCQALYANQF